MKKNRVWIDIKQSHWSNTEVEFNTEVEVKIYSKKFTMKDYSIFKKKKIREMLVGICKNSAMRVVGLQSECKCTKQFSELMIKHYGKETVMA